MQYYYSQDISASPEHVFELLENEDKMKQWIPELVANEYPRGKNPDNPVGTKFIQKLKEGGRVQVYNGEVIAYTRNEHLGIKLGNHAFSVIVHYRLKPSQTGTRLEYSCESSFNGWFYRMLGKMFSGFMKKMAMKQLTRLRELAEAN